MGTFDAGKTAARNSNDSEVPPNLLEFMLRSWRARSARAPRALRDAASFRARRERVSERFPGELLVIPTGHRKVRSNDTYYSFRPGTDFYYLTGALEPDSVPNLLRRVDARLRTSPRLAEDLEQILQRVPARADVPRGRVPDPRPT